MVLQPGFDRYEGLAYFGYTRDGEGHDAIINVGENFMEIKNSRDEVLSIWAPGAFTCNNLDIPMRCYFSGDEWIAPRDTELVEFMDRFLAEPEIDIHAPEVRKRQYKRAAIISVVGLAIALGCAYLILQSSLTGLIDESISARMDDQLSNKKFTRVSACDTETEPVLRDYLSEKAPAPSYQIVTDLGVNYARLPSGILAIDASWLQQFDDENTLIALINLANVRNQEESPARLLVSQLSILDQVDFLRTGSLTDEQADRAWPLYLAMDKLVADDISKIEDPVGNYADLAKLASLASTVSMPNNPSGLDFGEQDWLTLISVCTYQTQ